jgi:HlyD family secretion protein
MIGRWSTVWGALVIALLGVSGCSEAAQTDAYLPPDLPPHLIVEQVQRGAILDVIPAVGEIRAANQVEVGAEVGGQIIEVLVDFDDAVEAGQLLARIDPAPYEAAVLRTEAQLQTSEAALQEAIARHRAAEAELGRLTELAGRGTGAQAPAQDQVFRVEELSAAITRAEAGVTLARAQLAQARIDLERTQIHAPISGFVLDRRIEPGQSINAALSTPVLFVIAEDLSRVIVQAQLAEADVGRVHAGMDVRFTVDAYPREMFFATAGAVRRSPNVNGRFVTYPVEIEARDPEQRLLPGMTASVEFVAAEAFDVLRIPRAAFSVGVPTGFSPPDDIRTYLAESYNIAPDEVQGEEYVGAIYGALLGSAISRGNRILFVWSDGEVQMREVRPEAEDATHFADVLGEVSEGDWVIVGRRVEGLDE